MADIWAAKSFYYKARFTSVSRSRTFPTLLALLNQGHSYSSSVFPFFPSSPSRPAASTMCGRSQVPDGPSSLVWLITGCSSGLGRELVLAAAARGDRVIATARRMQDLDYCEAIGGVKALELDVTCSQADLAAKVREAIQLFGGLDVLVNNAGYVLSGVWEELR